MPYSVRQEDFESTYDQWERILPSCSTNTIFVTPWWQRIWWSHFGDGAESVILSVRDGDEVVGIAPLMKRDGVVSFAGDKNLFDYLDFVVVRGKEAGFYEAICEYLLKQDWHTLELTSVPAQSPTLSRLPPLAEGDGVSVIVTEEEMTPVAALPSTWDDYLSGLGKKDRHELRRKLRRLERADNARQYLCDDEDTLGSCMEDFFRLLKASSPDKMAFMTQEREDFFADVAIELSTRDQFRLYFLEVSGVRVASCICFDYGNSYLLYNSGYDPDYATLSVGLLNKALCIKDAIEAGRHSFNFLKGTERYKYNLGAKDEAVYNLVVRR